MGPTPPDDGGGHGEQTANSASAIVEAIGDGVFVVRPDRTIAYANDALGELTGWEGDELSGTAFERLRDAWQFQSGGFDRLAEAVDSVRDGQAGERQVTVELGQETPRVVDVHLSVRTRGDDREVVGVVRDVTERARQLEAAERKHEALAQLYEVGADAERTFDEKIERILAIGCEFLSLPYGFLSFIDERTQRMVHTVGDHELLQPGESAPLETSYCRKTIESDGLVGMADAETYLGADDDAYQMFGLSCYVGTKVMVGGDLYGTFCFAASDVSDRTFTPDEREVVRLLGQWAGYELERERFERRLEGLHSVSQRLLRAETTAEVGEIAVETGGDLFDLPVTACWEHDRGADALVPLAETDEYRQLVGTPSRFERGSARVWESFNSGEIRHYEDVSAGSGAGDSGTALHSEMHVPLGDHGILVSAATEPHAFDEVDVESLRLLGALVSEAVTAVRREETLVERGEALQRQNQRLEEFTRVLAHDLRNPLAGAVASFEVARETGNEEFFDRTEQSLDRMDELIDELLAIARGDRQAVNARDLSLAAIVEEAWSHLDSPGASLSVDDHLGQVHADETRLLQLFGNLFRNSVEHGGDDVTVTVGRLDDERGFYVADDGPGLPDEILGAIAEARQDGSTPGPGIGLASVLDVVWAHGWQLSVPETADGARFEIQTGR